MTIDLENIQSNHPFLTLIKVGKEEYAIPHQLRTLFLENGKTWWWESNRKLPINIFIGDSFRVFRPYLVSFAVKEVTIVFGPIVQLSDLTSSKRIRRKTVQLIRRVD
jgi:hypothetical protein